MKGWSPKKRAKLWRNQIADRDSDETRGEEVRRYRRVWRNLRGIRTWQYLILLLAFTALSMVLLRINNLGMENLRDVQLKAADASGDITEVRRVARELQNYSADHMNASAGRVPLQTLYNQAVATAMDANQPPNLSDTVYSAVRATCQTVFLGEGYGKWEDCIEANSGQRPARAVTPPTPDAYYIEFTGAVWSPDWAGFSVLICIIFALIILIRFALWIIVRLTLRIKYRS